MTKAWECDGDPNCPSGAMLAELQNGGSDVQYMIEAIGRIPDEASRCAFELGLARDFAGTRHLPAEFASRWMSEVGGELSRGVH